MRGCNHYTVTYFMRRTTPEEWIAVPARNKMEAYQKAVYEAIPAKEGELPYEAHVSSVTYQNGNVKYFR